EQHQRVVGGDHAAVVRRHLVLDRVGVDLIPQLLGHLGVWDDQAVRGADLPEGGLLDHLGAPGEEPGHRVTLGALGHDDADVVVGAVARGLAAWPARRRAPPGAVAVRLGAAGTVRLRAGGAGRRHAQRLLHHALGVLPDLAGRVRYGGG